MDVRDEFFLLLIFLFIPMYSMFKTHVCQQQNSNSKCHTYTYILTNNYVHSKIEQLMIIVTFALHTILHLKNQNNGGEIVYFQ